MATQVDLPRRVWVQPRGKAVTQLSRPRRRHLDYKSAVAEKDSDGETSNDSDAVSSDEGIDFDFESKIPLDAPSTAPSTVESTNDSLDGKPEAIESPGKPRMASLQPGPGFEVYNIEYSRYLVDEYGTDEVRAEIEHKPISATAPDKSDALFRWIHLKQDIMDFDAFQNTAKSLPDLTEEEIGDAIRLLQRGQRLAQKPFRTKDGHRGRVFGPQFLSKEIYDETSRTESSYFFYSLPYFCLRKHMELNIPSHSNLQPTRTLLQARDPSTSKGRDLEQAVCYLSGTPSSHCFHLSTLWCLVIKDKYILTCSLHSGTELSGEFLEVLKRPPSQPSVTVPERPQQLHVLFDNALHLIPIDECDSWFKLTQRFSVFRNVFDDVYSVYLNARRIESSQWPVVIRQARKQPKRTQVIISERKHALNRPLNKALLGSDDAFEIVPSQPSTLSKGVPSNASLAGFGKAESIREEEAKESPARERSSHPNARLKGPLSLGLDASDPLRRAPSASVVSFERYLQDFHALRWISVKFTDPLVADNSTDTTRKIPNITKPEDNQPRKSYDEKVDSYLEELHKHMQFKVGGVSQMKYRNCTIKSLREVEKALAGVLRGGLDDAKVVRLKQQIVTAAKSIFPMFLPLDQKGSIVFKYWGAVHASIIAPMTRNIRQIKKTVQVLMRIARFCIDRQAQLSRGKGPNPAETNLPIEFVRAWFHLLLCQLNLTQETISTARKKASKCENDLVKAMEAVMTKFEGKPLPELRAPVPSELSVFFVHRVLQDMTADLPGVSNSYWEYFTQLESLVKKDPLSRGYQAKIATFLEELDIIQEQLKEQRDIIETFHRGQFAQRDRTNWLAPGYHITLLDKCADYVSGTEESLSELQRKARRLEASWRNYMQSSKEQQERAIYVFTIVTIIFLPISTVSSIFGMNVKDVRDMNNGQWVFWAVAIPVTAIVIVGSLFGAGVLPFRGQQSIALRGTPVRTPAYSPPSKPTYPTRIPPKPTGARERSRRRAYSSDDDDVIVRERFRRRAYSSDDEVIVEER